jgi:predicted nucleotidyltransferase
MRLNQHQIETLKRLGTENFGTQAKLMLFGSRADDSRRGGDIDLYVTGIDLTPDQLFDAKLDFLVKAKRALGEQRIDVVFSPAPLQNPEPIHIEAQRTGIQL